MLKVTITTAIPVPSKAAESLKKALAKKHGSKVQYDFRIDESVIGGIKMVVGSKAMDMTVAGQLSALKKQLLSQV